jgi:hypothetical protein
MVVGSLGQDERTNKLRNSPVIRDLGGRAQAIFPPPPPVSSFEIKNFPNNCAQIGDVLGRFESLTSALLVMFRNATACEPHHTKFGVQSS